MNNPESQGFMPAEETNPAEIALERWGVDLNDDRAVLAKLQSLGGKLPDVVDLSNLWQDLQEQKNQKEDISTAA